ncbi:hypothetical protein ACTFIZ_011445 [Dictyostelium cf. discoideum]
MLNRKLSNGSFISIDISFVLMRVKTGITLGQAERKGEVLKYKEKVIGYLTGNQHIERYKLLGAIYQDIKDNGCYIFKKQKGENIIKKEYTGIKELVVTFES